MRDLLLKIRKRNHIYKFFMSLSTLLVFAVPISTMFGYFRGSSINLWVVWVVSILSMVYFMRNTHKKLSSSELEIIKNDVEYVEFKKVLKDFIKDESYLNYIVIEEAFRKFENNKIPENVIKNNFIDTLNS